MRYVHGLVTEILVNANTATIAGPPLALAAAVASPDKLGEVRSFEREWRTRQDKSENWSMIVSRDLRQSAIAPSFQSTPYSI